MKTSVIIPCYNAEKYVEQTIRSVLAQTRPPAEIIVVDDGSTDRSLEIVETFGGSVEAVSSKNGSAAVTRNQGYALSSGDFVMFLDADDVLAPDALEGLSGVAELQEGGVACCPWQRLELHDGRWVQRPPSCVERGSGEDPLKAWLRGWYHPTSSVLWTREAFERSGGWNPEICVNDDGDLMMRALALGIPFGVATHGIVYYRRLPDSRLSLSGKRFTRAGCISRLCVVENLAALLESHGRLWQYRGALGSAAREILRDCGFEHPDLVKRIGEFRSRIGDSEWKHKVRAATGRLRKLLSSPGMPGEPEPPIEIRFGTEADR
jgi:O-antigen biosynthesis protein